MPTTIDVRREIAERMRGPIDVCGHIGYVALNGSLFGMQLVACDEKRLRDALRSLAELIDPTTELERCYDHAAPFYRCSKCGGLTVLWQPGSRRTEFCPNCGRRVVDGGEGHE